MLSLLLVLATVFATLSYAMLFPVVANPVRRFVHRQATRPAIWRLRQYLDYGLVRLRWLAHEAGGAYYTWMQGLGITNLTTTFTHSLGQNGTNYAARILMKGNVGATQTAGIQVVGVSTNTITIAPMLASTLITFDLEVQQVHSLIS